MPLDQIINHDSNTRIFVWKITETLEELSANSKLNDHSISRLANMKSELHQRGFLSVRKLLAKAGYSDFDLYYDQFGKPNLNDGKHISISHSHECSAIIISDKIVGIDLELKRDKIAIIAHKFMDCDFPLNKESADYISILTVNWGVKESVFKIRNEPGISFKDHIYVCAFEMNAKKTTAKLNFNGLHAAFDVYFDKVGEYMLVYAFEKDTNA